MGAGGFIIIDESTCIVDIVRYFMEFIQNESCGKCIHAAKGRNACSRSLSSYKKPLSEESSNHSERFKGVVQLETIASVMKDTSLCGLGQTAPNPFLSTSKTSAKSLRSISSTACAGKCLQGTENLLHRCRQMHWVHGLCIQMSRECHLLNRYLFIVEEKCHRMRNLLRDM